ncbi:homoprotocatechuate degradation operon regulator HpaR [Comamonas faecalis]|uniref:Homoprotocatechuate degradation operon regulator HpaR n=1 Tax=Comamonas faecalis TaxID=1387849 RepID=A0ABP7RRL1_9BURK
MTQEFTHRNLPQLFLRAREELLRHFRPILTHHGLTEQQWRILRTLSEHGQLEPREICEICQILSPSMSGLLSRMEDLGLVTRTRMEEDQRRMWVRPTDKSVALVAAIAPLIEQQYQLLEQAYGKTLINEMYAAMDRFFSAQRQPVASVVLPGRRRSRAATRPSGGV